MSTNSLVGYLNEDGTVVTSYVHYDGYTIGVGEMLLENYNTDKCARDLASTLGYASSLKETVAESHEDRANSDEPVVFGDYHEFEEHIRECSYLEYVYVWDTTKGEWLVASWETTSSPVDNYWNGFESLVTVYVREGYETVSRWKRMVSEERLPSEYLDHSDDLNTLVTKWHEIGMKEVTREALSV
jgi:hypothetical protein